MMDRRLCLLPVFVAAASLGGCGWLWGEEGYFRDRGNDYLTARQTAPIETPPNTNTRSLDPLLPIPEQIPAPSHQDDYEVPRPPKLQVALQASDFSLQREGDRRWLVALRPPAQAWSSVREYLVQSGFVIDQERPQTGELVTEWQSGEALPAALARRLTEPSSDTRVRVRVEPGVQRGTSEIFVLSASRAADSQAEVAWADESVNEAFDAALLDDLLTSLASGGETQGASVSLLAEREYDAPARVVLEEDGNGNPVLQLSTDFERAWSAVGRALEAADIRVDDLNRSQGIYYVNLAEGAERPDEKPGFFGRLFGSEPDEEEIEARAERYQLRLTTVGGAVHVSLDKSIDTVAPEETARRVLSLIQANLG